MTIRSTSITSQVTIVTEGITPQFNHIYLDIQCKSIIDEFLIGEKSKV